MAEKSKVKLMTIKECARTGIMPKNTLRRLCKDNKVPCIKIAKRTLICYDALCEYLCNLKPQCSEGSDNET